MLLAPWEADRDLAHTTEGGSGVGVLVTQMGVQGTSSQRKMKEGAKDGGSCMCPVTRLDPHMGEGRGSRGVSEYQDPRSRSRAVAEGHRPPDQPAAKLRVG